MLAWPLTAGRTAAKQTSSRHMAQVRRRGNGGRSVNQRVCNG